MQEDNWAIAIGVMVVVGAVIAVIGAAVVVALVGIVFGARAVWRRRFGAPRA
ncbi:hypothetical protein [Streptomyces sp. B1I3]|uniref:hypothetical protein n=1 Tax=Streptomyces sp. B1I3 TaxID=3042264 RepID=UPI002786C0AF|nr:hypothetical protein [Streptomyces sp. B1I3]MDQ0796178.1 hypothetical protein [Streptomyces sp. B1I3]